jgi:hypothetical protein
MVRKLNFRTIVLIFVLLLPLPLYARNGSGFGSSGLGSSGFGSSGLGRGAFNTQRGASRGALFGSPSYTAAPLFKLTPAAESHGILQITLKTQDAEVYIDDRFVGLASDFNGTVMVSVPSGKHVVEFRYKGSTLPSAHLDIVPGSVTAVER